MNVVRTVLTSAVAAAIAVGVTLTGAGVASAAPSAPTALSVATAVPQAVTMRPTQIQFQWVAGQAQWAQPSLSRLQRSVFQVQSSGRFIMAQADGYPTVVGRMSADGTFTGDYRSSVGFTGSTYVHISGRITTTGGVPRMSLVYESGSATAAVVNGTRFGDSKSKVYQAQMVLVGA